MKNLNLALALLFLAMFIFVFVDREWNLDILYHHYTGTRPWVIKANKKADWVYSGSMIAYIFTSGCNFYGAYVNRSKKNRLKVKQF